MPLDFLARYKNQLCTFNDDIQGTVAVATATLLSAINVTGVPLEQQRIVVAGFGTAGIGITNLLAPLMQEKGIPEQEVRSRFYAIDRYGLVAEKVRMCAPSSYPTLAKNRRCRIGDSRMERSHCWM